MTLEPSIKREVTDSRTNKNVNKNKYLNNITFSYAPTVKGNRACLLICHDLLTHRITGAL